MAPTICLNLAFLQNNDTTLIFSQLWQQWREKSYLDEVYEETMNHYHKPIVKPTRIHPLFQKKVSRTFPCREEFQVIVIGMASLEIVQRQKKKKISRKSTYFRQRASQHIFPSSVLSSVDIICNFSFSSCRTSTSNMNDRVCWGQADNSGRKR